MTIVVHCREPHDVYIGRAVPRKGKHASIYANPFRVGEGANLTVNGFYTRNDSIERFVGYLSERPELCAMARCELRGKVLGCWCKPKACHGDILAALADSDCDCCHMAGVYNGYGSDGPLLFQCAKPGGCPCHD